MRIGATIFLTDRTIRPDHLARELEDRGWWSLWLPEHTHIPASRDTPAPTGDDELAEEYRRTLDPIVALTMAATVTERLRVGTGISLVAEHDPISLAKAVATLDHLSGGRVSFGTGFGWNREELADHGVAFAERRDVAREHVLAMRALWTDDEATFEGRHVSFRRAWQWPKPAQAGGPPVLVGGGGGPTLFAHIAEYGDGWIPIGGAGLARALPELRAVVADAGRDPSTLQIVPFGTLPDPGKLAHFAELGVTEVALRLPSAGPDEVRRVLDEYQPHVDAHHG